MRIIRKLLLWYVVADPNAGRLGSTGGTYLLPDEQLWRRSRNGREIQAEGTADRLENREDGWLQGRKERIIGNEKKTQLIYIS